MGCDYCVVGDDGGDAFCEVQNVHYYWTLPDPYADIVGAYYLPTLPSNRRDQLSGL